MDEQTDAQKSLIEALTNAAIKARNKSTLPAYPDQKLEKAIKSFDDLGVSRVERKLVIQDYGREEEAYAKWWLGEVEKIKAKAAVTVAEQKRVWERSEDRRRDDLHRNAMAHDRAVLTLSGAGLGLFVTIMSSRMPAASGWLGVLLLAIAIVGSVCFVIAINYGLKKYKHEAARAQYSFSDNPNHGPGDDFLHEESERLDGQFGRMFRWGSILLLAVGIGAAVASMTANRSIEEPAAETTEPQSQTEAPPTLAPTFAAPEDSLIAPKKI